MSSLIPTTTVTDLSARIKDWFSSTGRPHSLHDRKVISIAVASILAAITLPIAYHDYRDYMRMGPGGFPHNAIGWLTVSLLLCPLGLEMFSTEQYDRRPDKTSFLADVPRREGTRPVVGRHVVPQRQLDQIPGREIKEKLMTAFITLYQQNQHLIKLSPSLRERHTQALFLADGVQGKEPVATETQREIAHIHGTGDHSMHVTLPPQDCKKLIQAGWAQRHAFSGSTILKRFGTRGYLPAEYVLIYAPRNEAEVVTVMTFVRAGVANVAGVAIDEVR